MNIHRNCEGISRRNCLQLGLGSLVGGGLVGALRAVGDAAEQPASQANSCILIWMDGGPTHYETFDPKPAAPVEIRGAYGTIATRLAGVRFSKHMQRLAAIADKLTILRSIRHSHGNHGSGNHYMMTGAPTRIPVSCGAHVSFHPSMGSVAAHELSAPDGLPRYFTMPSMLRSGGPNFLGASYAPFVMGDDPNRENFRVRDVALPKGLSAERFKDREQLRADVDRLVRINEKIAGDPVVAQDQFYQQGHRLITSKQAQHAFDIQQEPDKVRAQYGRNAFGQRALLARRLVQAGVRFVTLNEGGWDHHVDLFNRLDKKLPPFEATIAALIEDLEQRGLLATTLVVALGEFGRTPKINKDVGRDHWSNAMSVLLAGGGTPAGQVIGATDRHGYSAVERVLSPEEFVATIYTKLGIDPGKILYTPAGRPVHLVSDPTPIPELLS